MTFKSKIISSPTYTILLVVSLMLFINLSKAEEKITLADNFTLKSQHGENIKLSELRGQVVLLNFWSSQCGTCIKQFANLDKFHSQFSTKGLSILAVNIGSDLQKITQISRKFKPDFSLLFDPYNAVSAAYNIESLPTYFLIDRDGNIQNKLNEDDINDTKKIQTIIQGLLNG
jgi:peroxiredoxin